MRCGVVNLWKLCANRQRSAALRRGFTMVESILAVVIVGGMLVAALNVLAASRTSQHRMSLKRQGQLLAQDLMVQVLQRHYQDPDGTPQLGLESNEDADEPEDFDDVDDYAGYEESPPRNADGDELADLEDWSRSVDVVFVQKTNLNSVSAVDAGVKRITVTVRYRSAIVASSTAIRTSVWPTPLAED